MMAPFAAATRLARAMFVVAIALASGCARHVVVEPQDVASYNDPDWRVVCRRAAATAAITPTPDAHCSKQ